jgi:hypothetical protein
MKTFGLILAVLLSGCATQVTDDGVDDKASNAVTEAHAAHAVQLTQAAKAQLGSTVEHAPPPFLNPDKADLAEAFPVYFVRLDELQAFAKSSDVNALLHETNERFHPVMQKGQVVSSTTLTLTAAGWQPAIVGETGLASKLQASRLRLQGSGKDTRKDYALVKVPALGVRFLMHREQAQILLTALDQPKDAEPRPAQAVFTELSEAARNVQP